MIYKYSFSHVRSHCHVAYQICWHFGFLVIDGFIFVAFVTKVGPKYLFITLHYLNSWSNGHNEAEFWSSDFNNIYTIAATFQVTL